MRNLSANSFFLGGEEGGRSERSMTSRRFKYEEETGEEMVIEKYTKMSVLRINATINKFLLKRR